ncbi:hypothetical protein EWR95_17630 [Escherichia coli]|nr:hypothetical protein [Escherichia coli]
MIKTTTEKRADVRIFAGSDPAHTATATSGISAATPALTPLMLDMVSDWDYREGERQGAAGGAKGDKKSGKVGVRYFDARDGRTREVKIDVESTDKRHPFTQPDHGTAKHCAESKVKRVQKAGRQMTITLPCRPELLKAGAEMRFVTQGFGVREDHHWQAESVEFSLVPGQGFTLNLSLTTDISAKGKASGKKKGVNYFG